MTPQKQDSPAIRISQGKRDASARATHLEAATRKFLVTTNERKQMSIKTNFKRIALVAVAALGMGVLSSVPSQAAVTNLTVTATNGSAILGSKSDTGTAAVISVAGLATVGNGDSITITFINKGAQPATVVPRMAFLDTATGNSSAVTRIQDTVSANPALAASAASVVTTTMAVADSITVSAAGFGIDHPAAAGYMGARFVVQLESTTASRSTSGTYSYTAIATSYVSGAVVTTATVDFTITIAALSSESKVANAGNSTVTVSSTAGSSTDEALSLDATVSTTNTEAGYLTVRLRNAAGSTSALGGAARESVTITIDKGQVGTSTNRGRSVVLQYNNSDYVDYNIYSDGTSGIATISVTTPSVTFPVKTVNFYSAAPKTLTTTVLTDTLKVGSNSAAIGVKAVDATGIDWTGTLYVYSDTVGTISNDASSCSYSAANARHECSLTGVTAGTAKITVRNAATVAASTVSATAVTATVSTASADKFTMAWDKASYLPGEKATLIVTVVDSAGKAIPAGTLSNLYATGGITLSTAAGNGSASDLTTVNPATASLASASNLYTNATPIKTYTIYMPTNGGTIEASATGGSSLPTAGQVKVTAKATITDNAAAALAAVNALSTTVASLRTLITTLTNLVLKIQKKVKA